MVYLKDHHEPIIDRNTWDKVQRKLLENSRDEKTIAKFQNRYWCSGKLFCGECGTRFTRKYKDLKDGSTYVGWRCFEAANRGAKKIDSQGNTRGCDSLLVNEKVLLCAVAEAMKFFQMNKEPLIKEMLAEIKRTQATLSFIDTAPLVKKIQETENIKSKAIDLALRGIISEEDLKKQNSLYDNEIDVIVKQIAEANAANSLITTQAEETQKYVAELSKIMDFGEENTLLYNEVLERITLFNNQSLIIQLCLIPFSLKIEYDTAGKSDNYQVIIKNIEIVR